MSKLYFNYGVMGSSKSANALMTHFNYQDRGQRPLMVKPRRDTRDSDKVVSSRIGLKCPCIYFDELQGYNDETIKLYDCIIIDEVQFLSEDDIDYIVHIVDDLDVPVVCYGLRTDFQGNLFTGSKRLMEMADRINEVKTVCWCGRKAIMNARFDESGKILRDGEQIQIGANESYTGLCRKHWREGNLGLQFSVDYKLEQEILNIQGSFDEDTVYKIAENKYNITDKNKILGILNKLCKEGKLEYGQVYSIIEE